MLSRLWSFLVLSRFHFLAGGVVMYVLGVVVAHAEGAQLEPGRVLWGQVGVSAIQLMAHFVNEYHDAGRDALAAHRTPFSGGSGVLPAGRLSMRVAARGAAVSALVGLLVTATLGWPAALVYAAALVASYGYSAPPLRLMTRGLGEPVAALTVALLTPLAGYSVAAGRLGDGVIWPVLPLLALSVAFMLTVELPDYEADRATAKRTWVVRLGRDKAGNLHNGFVGLAYALLALVAAAGRLPERAAALSWWSLPLAVWQVGSTWLHVQSGWRHYGLLAGGGMALVGLYGLLMGLGYGL